MNLANACHASTCDSPSATYSMIERENGPRINQRHISISQVTLGRSVNGQIQELNLEANELLEDEKQSVLRYAAIDFPPNDPPVGDILDHEVLARIFVGENALRIDHIMLGTSLRLAFL